jgi:hypothetical protein
MLHNRRESSKSRKGFGAGKAFAEVGIHETERLKATTLRFRMMKQGIMKNH